MLIPDRIRRSLKSILIIGSGLGIILRFVALGRQSLWVDEMLTLINAHISSRFEYVHFFRNLQGPAISAMMHPWGRISMDEAFLRLPFAVIGSLAVLAFYKLSRLLQASREALHSTFLFSLSPILIWYSQEIRGYIAAVALTILMTHFLLIWSRHPRRKTLLLYGVCTLGALLSNLTASFVVAAHFFYMLASPTRRRLMGRWFVAIFAVLLLFSPWIREIIVRVSPQKAILSQAIEPPKGGAELSAHILPYSVYTMSVGYTLGPSTREIKANPSLAIKRNLFWIAIVAGVFGFVFLLGLYQMVRVNPDGAFLLIVWLIIPMALSLMLAAAHLKVFTPRYVLVAIPAYLMIAGQGLSKISESRFYDLIVVVMVLLGISILNYFSDASYAKDDARSAAKQIVTGFNAGDVVVGVYSTEALSHYLGGTVEVLGFGADDLVSQEAMELRCQQITQNANRIWLFLCRQEMVDAKGQIVSWFERSSDLQAIWKYPGVELRLYTTRPTR